MQLKLGWSSWAAGKGLISLNKAPEGQMPQQEALPGHMLPEEQTLPVPTGEPTSPSQLADICEPLCITRAAGKHGSDAPSAPCRPGLNWDLPALALCLFPHGLWYWCHRYCSHSARGHTELWAVSPAVYPTNSAVQEILFPQCLAGGNQHFHLQAAN